MDMSRGRMEKMRYVTTSRNARGIYEELIIYRKTC